MKYFDVVNERDEIIGRASARECHSNPKLIHRVVHFTLVNGLNQKILLSKRSQNIKFDSGMWCFMGEHVLSGENYPEAAFRGFEKKLGLYPNEGIGEKGHTLFYQQWQTEFARFFVGYYKEGDLHQSPSEIERIKWVSLGELKQNKILFSKMTQYWIDHIHWEEVLRFSKAFLKDKDT